MNFTEEDIFIPDDGNCIFIETPVGPIQIGVWADTENEVDVTLVDHVNMGITGDVNDDISVVLDSCEWLTDLTLRDTKNAMAIDLEVNHELSPRQRKARERIEDSENAEESGL